MVDYEKLLSNFVRESKEILCETEDAVLTLEKEPKLENIDRIFRAVHTIKGNSGLFDLPRIRELSHAMENSLNHYRNHPPDFLPESTIDLYLTTIDRLKFMVTQIEKSNECPIEDLIQSYQALNSPQAGITSATTELLSRSGLPLAPPKDSRIGKVGIPKRYVDRAKEARKHLSLVVFNPTACFQSVSECEEFYRSRKDSGILRMGSVEGSIPDWGSAGSGVWKLYLLLESEEPPVELLSRWNFPYSSIRIVHSPSLQDSLESKHKSPVREGIASTKTSSREVVVNPEKNRELPAIPTSQTKEMAIAGGVTGIQTLSYLKIPVQLIDELINLASEAVIARNELLQKIEATRDTSLQASANKIGRLFSKLQEGIMKTRLQTLDSVFQKLPRIVRDISRSTGKQAELFTTGGDVELDTTVMDSISDPIVHIVRNSLDHGIETVEERSLLGKPERGMIRISAVLRGGNVIISVEDDGRGLNREKISETILEKSIMTIDQIHQASDEEIFNTLFLPGFSTAEKITTISGRGVGLDVVRTNLKKIGGTAEIANRPEGGTIVTLTIPQTLSIVKTLLIRTCGQRYAVPEQNIKELILIDPGKLNSTETHLLYNLRGHLLPVIDLGRFLNLPILEEYNPSYLVVLQTEKHSFGILIDEIINPEEIVVKSLGPLFSELTLFSGATIMGDGETVLILDVPGMAKFWNLHASKEGKDVQFKRIESTEGSRRSSDREGFLLFFSGNQQFAIPVGILPRIEKINPSSIRRFRGIEIVIYRGQSVRLIRLDQLYNLCNSSDLEIRGDLYGIFFQIENSYASILAYSVERVISESPELKKDTYTAPGIQGYAMIDSVHTIFLDVFQILNLQNSEHDSWKENSGLYLEESSVSGFAGGFEHADPYVV